MNEGLHQEVVDTIKKTLGQDISRYDETFIQKTVASRCRENDIAEERYIALLKTNIGEARSFCRALNVSYSVFFRDPLVFALLNQWLIPKLVSEKKSEIRVWSAGCAAGQEAYSAAMLLDAMSEKSDFRYRIFATDISNEALRAARQGSYAVHAMYSVPLKFVQEYFVRMGNTYQISNRLKQNVTFSYYDLLEAGSFNPQESIFGSFDIVFCSNLIMYYRPEYQRSIARKILRAVSETGYIITSEAERYLLRTLGNLRTIAPPAAILQKI
jgi:chemotaxis methyl-accepting protein methylase